ncbi:MAG: glutathione S-transferase family protein [bacterium]
MKLYMVPAAPNPTKVMLYIAERELLGVQMNVEQVVVNTLKGRHKQDEHLARNPFGTLPVLELDNGRYLIESLAIIAYLEDLFPQHTLLGDDLETKALTRDLERVIDLRLATPLAHYVHKVNSPLGLPPDPAGAAAIEANLPDVMGYLEGLLSDGRELLMGDWVSVADCTLAAALQFVRFAQLDVLQGYPGLQQWDARYRTRPAAQNVLKF